MLVLGGLGGVRGGLCPTLKYSKPPAAMIAQTIREKTVSFSLANSPAMALDYSYRTRTASLCGPSTQDEPGSRSLNTLYCDRTISKTASLLDDSHDKDLVALASRMKPAE